jgi:hypothetical protein
MTDGDLAHRYNELRYRMIECALTPDHPVTRANRARWKREFGLVERECDRRGLLEAAE